MSDIVPWSVLHTDLRKHHRAVIDAWTSLLDTSPGERECLQFIRDHAGFLLCDSWRALIAVAELEFGADLRPDFVVAHDRSSAGFVYELIEIEEPGSKAFVAKGSPSARLSSAVGQIQQWQLWLQGNRDAARKILPSNELW